MDRHYQVWRSSCGRPSPSGAEASPSASGGDGECVYRPAVQTSPLPHLATLLIVALWACAPREVSPVRKAAAPPPAETSPPPAEAAPLLAEATQSPAAPTPALEPLSATVLPDATDTPPAPARRFVDVEVGHEQACARRADGTVACWPNRGAATEVPGVRDAVSIALLGSNLCVAHRDGKVTCRNPDGERSLPNLEGARALSLRGYDLCGEVVGDTICVALPSGEVRGRYPNARGLDYESNLGTTCFIEGGGDLRCTGKLSRLGGRRFRRARDVAVTTVQGCTIDGGRLYCFRGESRGIDVFLGDGRGTRESPELVPVPLPQPEQVEVVGAFAPTTCARSRDGRVHCWGGLAELYGLEAPVNRPFELPNLRAVDISADAAQLCAATTDGQVVCLGSRVPYVDAVVPEVGDAVELATSYTATCARGADGTVWCWGKMKLAGSDRRLFAATMVDAARGLEDLAFVRNGLCGNDEKGARCLDEETLAWVEKADGTRLVPHRDQACVRIRDRLHCRRGEVEALRGADRYAIGGDDLYCGLFGRDLRCVRAPLECKPGGTCRYASSAPFDVLASAGEVRGLEVSTDHTANGRDQVVCLLDHEGRSRCARTRGTEARPSALPAGFAGSVRALRLNGGEACGITDDTVVCAKPGAPSSLGGYRIEATDIGREGRHTCVLLRDGRVTCRGANEDGQRGLGARWLVPDDGP